MVIDNKFNFGDTVYLKTDTDQKPRIVTGFSVRPQGLLYQLTQGTYEVAHYEFEITAEKNVLITTTN